MSAAPPVALQFPSRRWRHLLPDEGSDATQFYQFFQLRVDPLSPYRVELTREWLIARAMYLSHHWLDLPTTDVRDPRRAVRFTDSNPSSSIPKPVNNEILPVVDNESAKLYKRRSTAYVRPVALQDKGGQLAGGSAAADDILHWQLDAIRWPRKYRRAIFRNVLYGTCFFWSYLDQSYTRSVRIGIAGAMRCASGTCGFLTASPDIPPSAFEARSIAYDPSRVRRTPGAFNMQTGMADPTTYAATACPKCGAPLDPFTPDQAQHAGTDFFGRSLSQEAPLNTPDVEIPHPLELFPENDGIGVEFDTAKEWVRCIPRSLDYYEDHHPDRIDEIRPDDALTIADQFPINGEYSYGSLGATSTHLRNLWKDHALEYTAIRLPSRRYPMGRYVQMAGRTLLRDGPLCRPSRHQPDTLVPLVRVSGARFYIKDGELFGQSIVAPLVSPQNRINMAYAQVVDHRQRNMVSGVMGTTGMRFISGWLDGFPGRFIRWEPDPANPNFQPQFIDGKGIDQGVYQEIDRTTERMAYISGTQDADIGKAPRNVQAATAIQLLQEAAGGRREGREQDLIDAFRDTYAHQLLLLSEFAIEPRKYLAPTGTNKWEYRTFLGADLAGNTDVVVEEQAGYDARAFEREALATAVKMGIVLIGTPYARREAAKTYGVSMKVMDEENTQISDAEAKWYAFKDLGVVPAIDPDLDAHDLHYSVYGRFLKTPEGQAIADKAGWPAVLPVIAGWEKKLRTITAIEEQLDMLQAQAGSQDPLASATARITLASPQIQQMAQFAQALPKETAARILAIWQMAGAPVDNPFVQFRAVFSGHKVVGEEKKRAAMGGPVLAAPGGKETPAGTEPVLGSTPRPGEANALGSANDLPSNRAAEMQA